jgi:hypothetical protein
VHRQLISRTQYLAELNRRLAAHPAYVSGMQFIAHGEPEDPEVAAGFDWVPQGGVGSPPMPFAEVAAAVHALYRVAAQ